MPRSYGGNDLAKGRRVEWIRRISPVLRQVSHTTSHIPNRDRVGMPTAVRPDLSKETTGTVENFFSPSLRSFFSFLFPSPFAPARGM